jgi:hypothetical protein
MKFLNISIPVTVNIDSGWNCIPQTGKSRWRRPIISSSAVQAVISRHAGKELLSTRRE